MEIVLVIGDSFADRVKEWFKTGLLCLIPIALLGFIIYRIANIPDAPLPSSEDKEGAMDALLYQNTINQLNQYHGYPSF